MTVRPSPLGPQGPFAIKICKLLLLLHTAWCLPTCWVRRWSCGRTARPIMDQLPRFCPGRRCPYNADTSKFLGRGPCPRGKKDQTVLSLPRRMKFPISQEGVPRNRGSGGNDCERPLREGAHRKRPPVTLWFLSGDTERNPPRRAEPQKQSAALHKVLCQAFFQESGSSFVYFFLRKK